MPPLSPTSSKFYPLLTSFHTTSAECSSPGSHPFSCVAPIPNSCLFQFSFLIVIKYPDNKQLMDERFYFSSGFQVTVHLWGEVTTGAWDSWSVTLHLRSRAREMHAYMHACSPACLCPFPFLYSHTVQTSCLQVGAAYGGLGLFTSIILRLSSVDIFSDQPNVDNPYSRIPFQVVLGHAKLIVKANLLTLTWFSPFSLTASFIAFITVNTSLHH